MKMYKCECEDGLCQVYLNEGITIAPFTCPIFAVNPKFKEVV